MTAHAQLKSWLILQDSITALQMLGKAVAEPDGRKDVSVLWVAAVTMLRSVGHVLQKVDAANNPEVKRLLKEAWPHWKKARLFQLSEGYRNQTLKEYDFGWDHRYDFLIVRGGRYSFLKLTGESVNVLDTLWQVWHWWMDRVVALGHLIGSEPLSDRQKTYDCFTGRARITRQVL